MAEITRKICMLGDFGVGKTSLVERFVKQAFSAKYQTTVGVQIHTKIIERPERNLKLVLWDVAGKNALDGVRLSYLQGAGGVIVVADGTREATLRSALYVLMQARQETRADLPAVLLVNKLDRLNDWEVTPAALLEIRKSLPVFEASALSGEGVALGFDSLCDRL
jgi:small GTP-binding protein